MSETMEPIEELSRAEKRRRRKERRRRRKERSRLTLQDVKSVLRLWLFAKPFWRVLVVIVVLMAIGAAAVGARTVLAKMLMDDVLGDKSNEVRVSFDQLEILGSGAERANVAQPEDRPLKDYLSVRAIMGAMRQKVSLPEPGVIIGRATGEGRQLRILLQADLTPEEWARLGAEATDPGDVGEEGRIQIPFQYLSLEAVQVTQSPGRVVATEGSSSLTLEQHQLTDERFESAKLLALLAVILAIAIAGSSFFARYLQKVLLWRVLVNIRVTLMDHLVKLPLRFYDKQRSGELMSRLTNDVGQTHSALGFIMKDMIETPLIIVAAFAFAVSVSWQLSLVIFFVLPAIVIPFIKLGKKIRRAARKNLINAADIADRMHQTFSGMREVKGFQLETYQSTRFREENDKLLKTIRRWARAKATSKSLMEFIYNAGSAILIVGGCWVLIEGTFDLSLGDLAAFATAIVTMYQPAKRLAKAYEGLQESLAGADRIFELLGTPAVAPDLPGAQPFQPPQREVRFENVTFHYNEGEPVLKGIDLVGRSGHITAIVGPTGAGKSTIMDLLLRHYDPVGGRITVDGVDLQQVRRDDYLQRVATVSQDPFLFHDTIYENIRLGRFDATPEEIEAAAKAARIHDEIMKFAQGYQTVVGERGVMLSGGQRQRVTIARAILKGAPILVLDEATSSLDSSAEKQVQAALEALVEERTTFVIAHRLSTVQNAHCIYVLESGRIVEQGNHQQLMEQDGLYAQLFKLQAGEAVGA